MAKIELLGVQTHNLKNISVGFPLEKISVVYGVSGSGKSSLVFDTLYAESQRRYLDSLSSYARQFVHALPKPVLAKAKNLPAAVALKQRRGKMPTRSTVGSLTELDDLVGLTLTLVGDVFCQQCGAQVISHNELTMTAQLVCQQIKTKVLILASLEHFEKLKGKMLGDTLAAEGFSRLFLDGQVVRLDEVRQNELNGAWVVVDRLAMEQNNRARIQESCRLAFKLGMGKARVVGDGIDRIFHQELFCCDRVYQFPRESLFNAHLPQGACPHCQGFGKTRDVDQSKMFVHQNSSLAEEGVVPWNFSNHRRYYQKAEASAKKVSENLWHKPFSQYEEKEWEWLWSGDKKKFDGICGYFRWLETKRYKAHYRIHFARFHRYVTCSQCRGQKLNGMALAVNIQGKNYADLMTMTVSELDDFFRNLFDWYREKECSSNSVEKDSLAQGLLEGMACLTYLSSIGLGYLTLDRPAFSLSGGELQRISLARSLGSPLTGILFCLDEPTVGLHVKDTQRLIVAIENLKNQGNTVVIVDHDRQILEHADHVIELGPGAGQEGGNVIFSGSLKKSISQSLCFFPEKPQKRKLDSFITAKSLTSHNLRSVSATFPVGGLTVVCGVSGSGKTSLVHHEIVPLLKEVFSFSGGDAPISRSSSFLEMDGDISKKLNHVVLVSQEPMTRSTRSNIATYLGIFTEIRTLLSQEPDARSRGLSPSSFSFNVPGGRCEHCKGLGTVIDDLSFLGEIEVTCQMCEGKRFSQEVLSVKYKGLGILDILDLTITQCRDVFFDESPRIVKALEEVIRLGMGYLCLGQNTSAFSGGEAQRLKLLGEVKRELKQSPSLLVFDEPSVGLSDIDCLKLINYFQNLIQEGHTIIVIDHHLGLISRGDWIIEMGPGAGSEGGEILYQGSLSGLLKTDRSEIAVFLQDYLTKR